MISDLKERGKPGYLILSETEDYYDEFAPLREFCESFNLKRWGEPFRRTMEEEIQKEN
jgi:hypothetical protein